MKVFCNTFFKINWKDGKVDEKIACPVILKESSLGQQYYANDPDGSLKATISSNDICNFESIFSLSGSNFINRIYKKKIFIVIWF